MKRGVLRTCLAKDFETLVLGVVNRTYSGSLGDVRISGLKDLWWLAGWCLVQ